MKKLYLAALLTVGLSISAQAGVDLTPVDTKGGVTLPNYAGVSTCMITNSTGTAAVLCDSGPGIILQVIGSSVVTTSYLAFRDTATANTTSQELMRLDQVSIDDVKIYPRYKNGLSVDASSIPGPGATGAWTIIYKQLD